MFVTAPADGLGAVFEALAGARRAAVHDLDAAGMDRLRACGVEATNGFARLEDDVELLRAAAVRSALDARAAAWLVRLDLRAHVDSTNTVLLDVARAGSIDGHVVAAEVQTDGRGRRGRGWLSPFGRNLAVSVGVALARPTAEVGAFSLMAGLAVRRALMDIGVRDVELKWPNDILLEGRKLAGVLIDLVRADAREAVVGVGVNVGGAAGLVERVGQPISDVIEQVSAPSRNRLLAALINRVAEARGEFAATGFGPYIGEWERAHRHQRQTVTLTLPGSPPRVTGTALGVNQDGALRVATAAGVRVFASGEVTLRADQSPEHGRIGSAASH